MRVFEFVRRVIYGVVKSRWIFSHLTYLAWRKYDKSVSVVCHYIAILFIVCEDRCVKLYSFVLIYVVTLKSNHTKLHKYEMCIKRQINEDEQIDIVEKFGENKQINESIDR